MKYILSLATLLLMLGCGSESKTTQDTQQLQPKLENEELRPPKPPSL